MIASELFENKYMNFFRYYLYTFYLIFIYFCIMIKKYEKALFYINYLPNY